MMGALTATRAQLYRPQPAISMLVHPLLTLPVSRAALTMATVRNTRPSVPWAEQGAGGDCDPAFPAFTADVPTGGYAQPAVLTLPTSLIKGWLTNQGAQNFGLLLR